MGPYCKFCNTRCFKYTEVGDYVKRDLKATCLEGIKFDMDCEYPKLLGTNGVQEGWLLELRRGGDGFSLFAELYNGEIREYEMENTHFEEVLDFTKPPKENLYYRRLK